jgi:hypothetical protein
MSHKVHPQRLVDERTHLPQPSECYKVSQNHLFFTTSVPHSERTCIQITPCISLFMEPSRAIVYRIIYRRSITNTTLQPKTPQSGVKGLSSPQTLMIIKSTAHFVSQQPVPSPAPAAHKSQRSHTHNPTRAVVINGCARTLSNSKRRSKPFLSHLPLPTPHHLRPTYVIQGTQRTASL